MTTLQHLRTLAPTAAACLSTMGDVEEDAPLLKFLDEEDREADNFLYFLDMIENMGPPPEYMPTDEDLEMEKLCPPIM